MRDPDIDLVADVVMDTAGLWAGRIRVMRNGEVIETWLLHGFSKRQEAEATVRSAMSEARSARDKYINRVN